MKFEKHELFMRRALELALLGEGFVSPNPMVGAVIVKDGCIVGEGYHRKAGTPHAEIHALNEAGDHAKGATLYVTLEPCNHYGRTPPCTEAIIGAGVKRVIVACEDPNPLVAGGGIARLKNAGIEVICGILEDEAKELNEIFNKFIVSNLPFVALKCAMSLDGKIATKTGHSKWITNPKSRAYAHRLRHRYDAIMVGAGTVLADNPSLTAREVPFRAKNPIRVILDGNLRTSPDAEVYNDGKARTILVTADKHPSRYVKIYEAKVEKVIKLPSNSGVIDLNILLKKLAEMDITSILVEGGSKTSGAFMDAKLVDKVYFFIAPRIVGGEKAPGAVEGKGVLHVDHAPVLTNIKKFHFEEDMLVEAKVKYRE